MPPVRRHSPTSWDWGRLAEMVSIMMHMTAGAYLLMIWHSSGCGQSYHQSFVGSKWQRALTPPARVQKDHARARSAPESGSREPSPWVVAQNHAHEDDKFARVHSLPLYTISITLRAWVRRWRARRMLQSRDGQQLPTWARRFTEQEETL